jgi:nickel/cobalt transporter (NicO) family protein
VMSRLGRWSMGKTAWITLICGLGHVLSSVALGVAGIALGIAMAKLQAIDFLRGDLAARALTAFGLVYFVWGVRQAIRNRPHTHAHLHPDGHEHAHQHVHTHAHMHIHAGSRATNMTPWVLFTIFVFGPCEPLIPFVMYPAARGRFFDMVAVVAVFGTVTMAVMFGTVFLGRAGVSFLPVQKVQRYSHALAGATILACGLAIEFLGL